MVHDNFHGIIKRQDGEHRDESVHGEEMRELNL